MKHIAVIGLWVAIFVPTAVASSVAAVHSSFHASTPEHPVHNVTNFLGHSAHISAHDAVPTMTPLEVAKHTKLPGKGYSAGSPLYTKQQTWVVTNGDNSLPFVAKPFEYVPLPWRYMWVEYYERPVATFFAQLLHLAIWITVAVLYVHFKGRVWKKWEDKTTSMMEDGWKHHPLDIDCSKDWQLCCCAFFCPLIRWSDSVSMLDNHPSKPPFWRYFLVVVILYFLAPLTWGASLLLLACIGIFFRQRIRAKYQHSPGKPWTIFYDSLLWCCVPCIAIAQEAREVEEVRKANEDL